MSGGRIVGTLCLLAPLLSGCSGSAVRNDKPDPLVGLNAPPIPKEVPSTAKNGPLQPVPALAAPSAATSPAALASGAVPKLDSDRNLRIGGDADATAAWRGQNPSATLGQPTVKETTRPESNLIPVPTVGAPLVQTGATSSATGTIDQMMHYLESRGVKGFRLEMQRETGQWRCTCAIPDPQNPAESKKYDTSANPATDPQTALRAVVEQVEHDFH
jgi:hypothetical protein